MKEILYVPTGELVRFFDTRSGNNLILASEFISSGLFEEKFKERVEQHGKNNASPYDLIVLFFVLGNMFGPGIYDQIKAPYNLSIEEFEIIEA